MSSLKFFFQTLFLAKSQKLLMIKNTIEDVSFFLLTFFSIAIFSNLS